jgi:hypothetical protein
MTYQNPYRPRLDLVPPGYTLLTNVGYHIATFVYADGTRRMLHHRTVIATIHPDGSRTLNTGGHRSATTKRHMNDALQGTGRKLRQLGGTWFLDHINGSFTIYEDGMTIRLDGTVV